MGAGPTTRGMRGPAPATRTRARPTAGARWRTSVVRNIGGSYRSAFRALEPFKNKKGGAPFGNAALVRSDDGQG